MRSPASSSGETRLATGHGEAATGFSLLVLDAAGIPAGRVRLVNDAHRDGGAQFAAVTRPLTLETSGDAPNKILLTTADAPQAVPLVAVAPHGLIESHGDVLKAWSKAWIEGAAHLRKDVPTGARLVAQESGAPEASTLLERLGQIESATVHANARALGLSGRSAVTVPVLFQRYLRLWRDVGAISIPLPETAPISTSVFAALVRSDPSLADSAPGEAVRNGVFATVLLASRVADTKVEGASPAAPGHGQDLDESTLVESIGFLADTFERAEIRVSARAPGLAKAAVESAYGRFDIAAGRLLTGSAPQGSGALLEVLVGP